MLQSCNTRLIDTKKVTKPFIYDPFKRNDTTLGRTVASDTADYISFYDIGRCGSIVKVPYVVDFQLFNNIGNIKE
jgi:hypothetical protein